MRIIIILTFLALASLTDTRSIENQNLRKYPYFYNYGFNIVPKWSLPQYSYQTSGKADTDVPQSTLTRYWNNLVRRVRLPSTSWNMSSTFGNLFNGGNTNVVQSPIETIDYDNTIKKKTSSKNKKSKKSSNRKELPTSEYPAEDNNVEQLVLHPYKALFFYDPKSKQYYELRKVGGYPIPQIPNFEEEPFINPEIIPIVLPSSEEHNEEHSHLQPPETAENTEDNNAYDSNDNKDEMGENEAEPQQMVEVEGSTEDGPKVYYSPPSPNTRTKSKTKNFGKSKPRSSFTHMYYYLYGRQ